MATLDLTERWGAGDPRRIERLPAVWIMRQAALDAERKAQRGEAPGQVAPGWDADLDD